MNSDTIKGAAKTAGGTLESKYGEVTGDATARVKGEATAAKGKIISAFGKIEDKVNDFVSYASDETEVLKNQISEKPVQSALIALGVGFLIGKLLG